MPRVNQPPPRTTSLNELLGILQAVADDPAGVRPIAADWLDTHVEPEKPSDHRFGRLPGWFRKTWRRSHPSSNRGFGPGFLRLIDMELREVTGSTLLDHWGTVYVRGVAALLSEPYADPFDAETVRAVDAVAGIVGGVGLCGRRSAWLPNHTCRLLWFPNPWRLDEAMKGMGNLTFYQ